MGLLLSGAGPARADGWSLPENISTTGGEIDHMFWLIFWITTATFFITMGVLVYSVAKFRYKEGQKAQFIHGSHKLELAWTLVPAGILLFLALYQTKTWAKIKMDPPDATDAVQVRVFAKQFEWNFRYAGADGEFDTEDDICTINDLYVPENRDVILTMRSLDVIHSLFLPYLRFKQDLMPGMTIDAWFQATKTTEQARSERGNEKFNFEIACTELCGLGHHEMRGKNIILSEAAFQDWIEQKSKEALELDKPEIWDSWDLAGGEIRLPELHDEEHGEEGDDEWDDEEWEDE